MNSVFFFHNDSMLNLYIDRSHDSRFVTYVIQYANRYHNLEKVNISCKIVDDLIDSVSLKKDVRPYMVANGKKYVGKREILNYLRLLTGCPSLIKNTVKYLENEKRKLNYYNVNI